MSISPQANRRKNKPRGLIRNRTIILWCDEIEHAYFGQFATAAGFKTRAEFAYAVIGEGMAAPRFAHVKAALTKARGEA